MSRVAIALSIESGISNSTVNKNGEINGTYQLLAEKGSVSYIRQNC